VPRERATGPAPPCIRPRSTAEPQRHRGTLPDHVVQRLAPPVRASPHPRVEIKEFGVGRLARQRDRTVGRCARYRQRTGRTPGIALHGRVRGGCRSPRNSGLRHQPPQRCRSPVITHTSCGCCGGRVPVANGMLNLSRATPPPSDAAWRKGLNRLHGVQRVHV